MEQKLDGVLSARKKHKEEVARAQRIEQDAAAASVAALKAFCDDLTAQLEPLLKAYNDSVGEYRLEWLKAVDVELKRKKAVVQVTALIERVPNSRFKSSGVSASTQDRIFKNIRQALEADVKNALRAYDERLVLAAPLDIVHYDAYGRIGTYDDRW